MADAEEEEIEVEVLMVSEPVEDIESKLRRFYKRREHRKSGREPAEVITIPDEPKKKKRKPDCVTVSIKQFKESKQGFESDNAKGSVASSSGCGTSDDLLFVLESTNDSGISTSSSVTNEDTSLVLSDVNDSIISPTSGTTDISTTASESLPISASESSSSSDDNGLVIDPADLLVPPPSPSPDTVIAEECTTDGMPKLCGQLHHGDFEGDEEDDFDMPALLAESTGNCGDTDGGSQVQVAWMEDGAGEREIRDGRKKKKVRVAVVKKRLGLKKKGPRFLSMKEARSGANGRLSWCKICDTYFRTMNELRGHIGKVHNKDGSLVNRFNQATWDLEIARTFEIPMDMEKAQET